MRRRHFLAATAALPLVARGAVTSSRVPLKAGQIGTGHSHASGKLTALLASPDWEVVGVVEPDPARRQALSSQVPYRDVKWIDEEQLFNTPGLKAVAVETAMPDLIPSAERVVAAGHHLHLDKPPGDSLSRFRRLHETAARKGLTVQLGYMLRYNPAFELLYRMLDDGLLGRVFTVDAVMGKALGREAREGVKRSMGSMVHGGTMFELACHVVDAVVKVLGRPDQVRAHNRSSSKWGDGFPDNQLAVLDYPAATATVRSSLLEVGGGARRQFVVCGDEGTFDVRPLEPARARLALERERAPYRRGYQDLEFPKGGRYDAEFLDLARVVRGEKAFGWSMEHDLAVHETVLRASGMPLEPKADRD